MPNTFTELDAMLDHAEQALRIFKVGNKELFTTIAKTPSKTEFNQALTLVVRCREYLNFIRDDIGRSIS